MSITREAVYRHWGTLLEETAGGDFPTYYCASGFTHPMWPALQAESPQRVALLRWGLVPFWVKDNEQAAKMRRSTLNARSETAFEKPSFRSSIPRRRCLVLVDGFFEPHKHEGTTYQFYCYRRDGAPFALAGIYSAWKNPDDGETETGFSILTTPANRLFSLVHNEKLRMPVVLEPDAEERWIDPALGRSEIEELLEPRETPELTAHTVSRRVSTRSADPRDPEMQKRVEYPELDHLHIP